MTRLTWSVKSNTVHHQWSTQNHFLPFFSQIIYQTVFRWFFTQSLLLRQALVKPSFTCFKYTNPLHFRLPADTRDKWSDELSKQVFSEFYVMDGVTLMGIVGGTLGLFVGLSFMELSSRLVQAFTRTWQWMNTFWIIRSYCYKSAVRDSNKSHTCINVKESQIFLI